VSAPGSPGEGWGERLRAVGFLVAMAGGSAALGFAIAWPLWFFATSHRQAYTIFALSLAAAALVFGIVRSLARRRRDPRSRAKPRLGAAALAVSLVRGIIFVAGLYLLLAFVFRGLWLLALPGALLWAAIVWLLSRLRRVLHRAKVPADNHNG
jgi:hypothetical protein